MLSRRAEAAVAAGIFALAAIWGAAYFSRYVRRGGRPFFYQTYFEPAVMLACGRGFVIGQPQPAPVTAFLFQRTDRFSCAELPPDLIVGTAGMYQRPWRYLLTTVALAWKLLGISWSGLAPLFGILFGATTTLAYVTCRLITGRAAAIACAATLALSPLQLANLPNLRDYAKAPFTLALVAMLVALVVRPWRARDVVLLSLVYGAVMGIGYGFRTDLLIDFAPFLVTIALFLPGGVASHLPAKLGALAAFAVGFAAAAWPVISAVASGGGCQWHFLLLGLTSPFNDALGVAGGDYGWGHLYKDEYLWATVASYASRFRPDLGYIDYCSHEYDVASGEYLRHILTTFPADLVARAYASALHVLELPFQRLPAIAPAGPLLAAVFVTVLAAFEIRYALFALFVVLYFCGHPAIQFLPRHYFPFEIVTLVIAAWLADRVVRLLASRRGGAADSLALQLSVRRAAVCAAAIAAALLAPLWALRWYQQERVSRLLAAYASAPTSPLPVRTAGDGHVRLAEDAGGHAGSQAEAVDALGRGRVRFVQADVDPAKCRPDTTLTFVYDATYPVTDFSKALPIASAATPGITRVFEPVYAGFRGVDVSDPSPGCLGSVSAVANPSRWPLLLPAQLAPGWESHRQYQHIEHSR
jgi:hypothetical protein